MYNLAGQLKEIRIGSNLTQKQVAEGIGVTEQAYQRYEYGKVVPSATVLAALADFYNVPLDFVCGRGVFSNWSEYTPHLSTVAEAIAILLEISPEILQSLPVSTLASIIAVTCARITYDSENNTVVLFPLLSPKDVRQCWSLDL